MPNPVTESGDAPGLTGAPILLAIETAGSRCSAAVTRGERILASVSQALRHGHGEALLPIVDRAMSEAEIKPSQLTMVAVAIGPGGFTGIRVGLAAAQGIALATGARLLGVTGFAAVAQALRRTGPGDAVPGANLLVALDSRRDDLYVQLFAPDMATPLAPPCAVLPDALEEYVGAGAAAAPLLLAGDAAEAAAAALPHGFNLQIVPDSIPDAVGVAAAALEAAGSVKPVRPLYLRPPDVTLPKPPGMPTPVGP